MRYLLTEKTYTAQMPEKKETTDTYAHARTHRFLHAHRITHTPMSTDCGYCHLVHCSCLHDDDDQTIITKRTHTHIHDELINCL